MSKRKMTLSPETPLDEIESHLAGTLKPVAPPKGFVQHLRARIHLPHRAEIAIRLRDWQTLALVFGGVISGGLVILTLARAMFHLFGRRNVG
ncbi:MAG: hypothetical protein HYR93_08270 [Chloroflexi bacterium]|nr:hypothetical protein [Chloroflexota bacterium]